jgi:sec-independent protein translocase protein TatC
LSPKERVDPDRMTFLEHLEELRVRLIRCAVALVVTTIACWQFRLEIFHFLTQPLRDAYPAGIKFMFTAPTEGFMLNMKMAFFVGIFAAAPFLLYQVWSFIAPGLSANERIWAIPFIGFGTIFFLLGAAFGHFYLFPSTFEFLGQFANADIEYRPKVDEYFSFYSWFLLGLGLVFQLPVVIFVLSRIGLVTPGFLIRNFKYAVLATFVVSAVITPGGDMMTQTLLAGPMLGLYLLGVGIAWLFGKPRRPESQAISKD